MDRLQQYKLPSPNSIKPIDQHTPLDRVYLLKGLCKSDSCSSPHLYIYPKNNAVMENSNYQHA